MAHRVELINSTAFAAHVEAGDVKRLCEDSYSDVYLPSAIDFQGLLSIENEDINAEDLTDDQIYSYWRHKFSGYADENMVWVDNPELERGCVARYQDDVLVELKCVTFEGNKVTESNSIVGKDGTGSKAWIYSDAAGRPLYDFYKSKGANKIEVFTYAGSHAIFILKKTTTYGDISTYVDFANATFEDVIQSYTGVNGETIDMDFVKYTVDIKDY